DFYRRIGVENQIRWYDQMTFLAPGGRASQLAPSFMPPPLQTFPAFLRFPFLGAKDKVAIARAMAAMIPALPPDDGHTFLDWLHRHRQTPAAIERFWKPVLISALSEDLDRVSVPAAAQVVRETSKSVTARRMGIPTVPLTDLYAAAHQYV